MYVHIVKIKWVRQDTYLGTVPWGALESLVLFSSAVYHDYGLFRNLQAERPGVDVMVTIFCDFCQFSTKNWRFSQKPLL
jgi:hypothetical protein